MDETPEYFISSGKIYGHHYGSTYVSGGFSDHTPSYDQFIADATPININNFLKSHKYLYNYDEHKQQTHIISDYKDAFDNDIFVGNEVLFMNCHTNGSFDGYIKGKVVGFTKEYVKIKPIKYDKFFSEDLDKCEFLRKPYRIIVYN